MICDHAYRLMASLSYITKDCCWEIKDKCAEPYKKMLHTKVTSMWLLYPLGLLHIYAEQASMLFSWFGETNIKSRCQLLLASYKCYKMGTGFIKWFSLFSPMNSSGLRRAPTSTPSNTDCEPVLITLHQCWTSLMLFYLNGSKSLKPGSTSGGET